MEKSFDTQPLLRGLLTRDNLNLLPLGIFLFSLPFSHTVALRLLMLFAAALIALTGWRARHTPPIPLRLPLALWAGMALVSLAWAGNLAYSVGEIRSEIGYTIVAFLTFYSMVAGAREWRFVNAVLIVSFLAISTVGLYWFALGRDQITDAPHGGVGHYSTYLITILPLLIVACIRGRSRTLPAMLLWLLIPLLLLDGYGTSNRAFWLTVIVEVVLFAALYAWHLQSKRARLRVFVICATLGVLSAATFVETVKLRLSPSNSDVEALEKTVRDDARLPLWEYFGEQIRQRPFTGTGFGRGNIGAELTRRFESPLIWHGHNVFLNYALQMGLGGVLALAVLFGAIGRQFWQLYRSDDGTASLIGIAGIAMLVGFICKNMTDDFFVRHNALIFWSVVGMSLGYGRRLMDSRSGA